MLKHPTTKTLTVCFLSVVLSASVGTAEEIPLAQVWGYGASPTRDVRLLDPDSFGRHTPGLNRREVLSRYKGSLVVQLRTSLSGDPFDPPPPTFAVKGTGLEALKSAHAVMVGGEDPLEVLPAGEAFSVVVRTRMASDSIRLAKVDLDGDALRLEFTFLARRTANVTGHYYLIPMTPRPAGSLRVTTIATSPSYTAEETERRRIKYLSAEGDLAFE